MSVTASEIQGSAGLAPAGPSPGGAAEGAGAGGLTFRDFLDVINPLQHIPILSSIYRGLTGTTIAPAARLAGDTLFGGPLGFIGFVVNSMFEGTTGKDIGGNLLALFQGPPDASPDRTLVAEAAAGPAPPAAADAAQGPIAAAAGDADDGDDGLAAEARLFAAARRESAHRSFEYRAAMAPPSGAVAAEGGWFSDVMLSALDRYEAAAKLRAGDSPGRNLDERL